MMREQSRYLRINDPIHGTIQFPKEGLIHKLIDSREFQRLRRIKQLGTVDFVYPCATHTRFSHSIGVAHLVEKAAKELLNKKDSTDETIFEKLKKEGYFESYNNVNQVILALTCAGLLHDIGHTPFSHTLESYFYKKDHIKNTIELIEIDTEVCSILDSSIKGDYGDDQKLPINVKKDIKSLIRHDKLKNNALSPLSDLISCQLDCDRLDYIQRDNYFCGTPIKIDCDYIIKCMMLEKVKYIDNKYKIVFLNNAIAAIEHFLMSRWIHYKQIINHKTCLATEVLLTKIVG